LSIFQDSDHIEFTGKPASFCRIRPEIDGNGCRPQHPHRDHQNDGFSTIANADANLCFGDNAT
jgi:hypothetical protein